MHRLPHYGQRGNNPKVRVADDPFVIVIIGRKAIKKCFRCLGQGVLVRIIGSRNLHLVTIRVAEIDPGSELGEGFD